MGAYAYFEELPVSTEFAKDGNVWRKRSTRTAEIVRPVEYAGTWFYFGQRDLCVAENHSRLSKDYFGEWAK